MFDGSRFYCFILKQEKPSRIYYASNKYRNVGVVAAFLVGRPAAIRDDKVKRLRQFQYGWLRISTTKEIIQSDHYERVR